MKIEKLGIRQLIRLYPEVRKAFPAKEVRPLGSMLFAAARGRYDCFALTDGGEILAYAYFTRVGSTALLDYLCVLEGRRNRGLGSEFLKLLSPYLDSMSVVLAEVEDPAENDADRPLRQRRLRFYLRLGFTDTGLRPNTFGVPFLLLERKGAVPAGDADVRAIYTSHYRMMLPRALAEKAVRI